MDEPQPTTPLPRPPAQPQPQPPDSRFGPRPRPEPPPRAEVHEPAAANGAATAGGPESGHDGGPGVQPTGHPEVDAQLRRLADAGDLAVAAHLEVYEDAHRALRDTLTALDQRPGPGGAS